MCEGGQRGGREARWVERERRRGRPRSREGDERPGASCEKIEGERRGEKERAEKGMRVGLRSAGERGQAEGWSA